MATFANRACQLVAFGDAVLQEVRVPGGAVGEQRDRVLGIVVLREHDDAGAGMPFAELLRGVDPLALKAGGMRMSVTSTCGAAAVAPATSSS